MPKRTAEFTPGPEQTMGPRLRLARKKKKITASELSDRTKISTSSLTRYESGERSPGATELRLLCDELDVSPQFLIYGDESKEFSAISASIFGHDLESDNRFIAISTVLLQALPRPDRMALTQLLYSLVSANIGEEAVNDLSTLIGEFTDAALSEIDEPLTRIANKLELELTNQSK